MLTPEGQVKVLDFCLVTITRPEGQAATATVSAESHTIPGDSDGYGAVHEPGAGVWAGSWSSAARPAGQAATSIWSNLLRTSRHLRNPVGSPTGIIETSGRPGPRMAVPWYIPLETGEQVSICEEWISQTRKLHGAS
jgi:hypothetical protein